MIAEGGDRFKETRTDRLDSTLRTREDTGRDLGGAPSKRERKVGYRILTSIARESHGGASPAFHSSRTSARRIREFRGIIAPRTTGQGERLAKLREISRKICFKNNSVAKRYLYDNKTDRGEPITAPPVSSEIHTRIRDSAFGTTAAIYLIDKQIL